MSKIIIHNQSVLEDHLAVIKVSEVIQEGRISNSGKNYCYATVFPSWEIAVVAKRNKDSDTFFVHNHIPKHKD